MKKVPFETLKEKVLRSIKGLFVNSERVEFVTEDGEKFYMYHDQECCENVYLADIEGAAKDLLSTPLLVADESIQNKDESGEGIERWTFYKLATIKGSVDFRWYGTSNGYYSVEVDLYAEDI